MLTSNGTIVVTTGEQWADIDAFACVIAYTEALNASGQHAVAVIPGTLNASIPEAYKALGTFESTPPQSFSAAVICDVSDPKHIAAFLRPELVTEVFDHHDGYEIFWSERIGDFAHIEIIGAAATLIWENIRTAELVNALRPETAKLIAAAIASNTLNFQIAITHNRDHRAFEEAATRGSFTDAVRNQYFSACETDILNNLSYSLANDTKLQTIPQFNQQIAIGQLELWHSEAAVLAHAQEADTILSAMSSLRFLTAPSIGDRYTVMHCTIESVRDVLTRVLGVTWNGPMGRIERLILRKEILKALRSETHL